jgi:hypothetical protein
MTWKTSSTPSDVLGMTLNCILFWHYIAFTVYSADVPLRNHIQLGCLFGVSLKKFDFTGSVTPKNRQKVGVVYDFPAKLENSIKTHISVKSRDIDTKFEP